MVLLQTFKGVRQMRPISFMASRFLLLSDVHLTKKLTFYFVQKVAIYPKMLGHPDSVCLIKNFTKPRFFSMMFMPISAMLLRMMCVFAGISH